MVGVREAIPFGETASTLFGSGKPFALAEAEQREMAQLGHPLSFPAKAVVFTEGESADAVYKLTRGTAALYKLTTGGRRQVVNFALPGDILASPFSDRHPCSADAISEISVRRFLRRPFLAFLGAHPTSLWQMLESTARETNAARDHMLMLGCGTAAERLVEFIIKWRKRVGRKGALANLVPLPMSRRDIADHLGLTIETISRLLAKFEREDVVRVIPEGLQLMGSTERPLLLERNRKILCNETHGTTHAGNFVS
jgi:CRP/FNR family transcriptional regulator, anaerobic regulatory protein